MDHAHLADDDGPFSDGIDAFTAWLLTWQHFILPCLAILAFATLYS